MKNFNINNFCIDNVLNMIDKKQKKKNKKKEKHNKNIPLEKRSHYVIEI